MTSDQSEDSIVTSDQPEVSIVNSNQSEVSIVTSDQSEVSIVTSDQPEVSIVTSDLSEVSIVLGRELPGRADVPSPLCPAHSRHMLESYKLSSVRHKFQCFTSSKYQPPGNKCRSLSEIFWQK